MVNELRAAPKTTSGTRRIRSDAARHANFLRTVLGGDRLADDLDRVPDEGSASPTPLVGTGSATALEATIDTIDSPLLKRIFL